MNGDFTGSADFEIESSICLRSEKLIDNSEGKTAALHSPAANPTGASIAIEC
jgi:hypothetical protein